MKLLKNLEKLLKSMGRVDTGPVIIGIYKITNLINGKFYIGQSININYRFYEHQIGTGHFHKSAIDAAIKKYGKENFSYEILEECDREDVFIRERYWAEEVYDGQCYAPFGYNIDRTGRGSHKINWVSQYDMDGNKIKSYFTASYAARELGVSATAIRQAILKNGTCCGSMWAFGLLDKIDPYVPKNYGIPINAYNSNGNLCLMFKNGVEAAEYFNITTSAINSYVMHKSGYVCCGGYYLAKQGEPPIIRESLLTSYGKDGVVVYQYHPETRHLIAKFNSYIKAAESLGVHDTKSIRNCCNGIQNLGYGYIWSNIKFNIIPENYREINKQNAGKD